MSPPTAYLLFLASIFFLFFLYGTVLYIKFAGLRKKIESSLKEIDNNLEGLLNLAQLIEDTFKKHISNENDFFPKFNKIKPQNIALNTVKGRILFQKNLEELFEIILDVSSNYHGIKKDENVIKINARWSCFMDNIKTAKTDYNKAAMNNKKLLSSFPSFLIGLMFSFKRAELFVEKD